MGRGEVCSSAKIGEAIYILTGSLQQMMESRHFSIKVNLGFRGSGQLCACPEFELCPY